MSTLSALFHQYDLRLLGWGDSGLEVAWAADLDGLLVPVVIEDVDTRNGVAEGLVQPVGALVSVVLQKLPEPDLGASRHSDTINIFMTKASYSRRRKLIT